MNSKKGILGGIMATFIATVVILMIILVFIIGAGAVKKMTGANEGVAVVSEEDVGLKDILNYLPNYAMLMKVNVLVAQGKSVEDAMVEVGYVE